MGGVVDSSLDVFHSVSIMGTVGLLFLSSPCRVPLSRLGRSSFDEVPLFFERSISELSSEPWTL